MNAVSRYTQVQCKYAHMARVCYMFTKVTEI